MGHDSDEEIMSRPRIHIPPDRWLKEIVLEEKEWHYLTNVLRLSSKDIVEVFDGEGRNSESVLLHKPKGWCLEPKEGSWIRRPNSRPVVVGPSLLKGRKLDEVVRMITEVGVAAVVPFLSERSIVRSKLNDLEKRVVRWRSIAVAAARQSGRSTVPEVKDVQSWIDILQFPCPVRLALHAQEEVTIFDALADAPEGERFLLIGPEGGFSEKEIRSAKESGFQPVSLGKSVLRADTAAVLGAGIACLDSEARRLVRVEAKG
jgi:16S rRNA (uracil1498-N3)-methyltransferase